MTKQTVAKGASGAKTPPIGRRGAAEIPTYQRVLFGVLGIASAAGGALLLLRNGSPELGGTALVIIAALFLALMVIGRLPKMLEIAGVPLEFDQDEMSEFLRTLRAAVDDDTVVELEEQLKNMSGNTKAFKDAQKEADLDPESSAPTTEARPTVAKAKDPAWLSSLKQGAGVATVEKNARVPGGTGSGRGQPPVVDHLVRQGDQPTLVLEKMSAWNESTLKVLGRRLNRVMWNLPTIEKLIVIMPGDGMTDAEDWRKSLWGNDVNPKVEVLAEGSNEALAVEDWVESLPPRPKSEAGSDPRSN
ncbi:hypothetical protein [Microbacterium sp. A94]|uniref:hypothetical protein n=1 Tax=Microbacterium sp. A94 TaxID=3450717 RepID=UPI003F4298E7